MNQNEPVAQREAQRKSNIPSAALLPPVDVVEDEMGITLIADLPGVSKDRLGVKVNGENLVIEAEASTPVPEGMELLYAEIPAPFFRRSFTLSRELDPSNIEANLKDGVLKLRIPKAEEAKPRRIEVNVG
jgi:HSP20 family protein